MDIKRDTSGAKKLRILYGAIGVLVIGGITVFLSQLDRAAPTVDSATLWKDSVQRGELLLERRGAGTLVPEEVRAITARTAGRIEERYLLPGAQVTDDTVLLRLSNPDVELAAQNAQWALDAGRADLRNLQVTLQTNRLQQQSSAAQVQANFKIAQLRADLQQQLFDEELASELDLQLAVTTADEAATRHGIEQQRMDIIDDQIAAQLESRRTQVQQLEAQHQLAVDNLEALNVRAGIVGQVKVVSAVVTARMPYSSSAIGRGVPGPIPLNTPAVPSSAMRIIHSVRSRTSMICTGSDPSPGASTSPPRWIRTGQ